MLRLIIKLVAEICAYFPYALILSGTYLVNTKSMLVYFHADSMLMGRAKLTRVSDIEFDRCLVIKAEWTGRIFWMTNRQASPRVVNSYATSASSFQSSINRVD